MNLTYYIKKEVGSSRNSNTNHALFKKQIPNDNVISISENTEHNSRISAEHLISR